MTFPEQTIQAFKAVVLAHMKNLDPIYWLAMQPRLEPEEVCTCYLVESSCPASWYRDCGHAVCIDEVAGLPLYFNSAKGIYYIHDPDRLEGLDIIIDGRMDFYPGPGSHEITEGDLQCVNF